MRRLSLNLLTSSATILLLGVLDRSRRSASSSHRTSRWARSRRSRRSRAFGVYVDPWHIDDWARKIGAAPQLVAKFEAFSRRRTIDSFLTSPSGGVCGA